MSGLKIEEIKSTLKEGRNTDKSCTGKSHTKTNLVEVYVM